MTDLEIVTLVVSRCQVEVEAVVGPIPDPGSVWGRSLMRALHDIHQEQEEEARIAATCICPDCSCQLDPLSGAGTHQTLCPRFPL